MLHMGCGIDATRSRSVLLPHIHGPAQGDCQMAQLTARVVEVPVLAVVEADLGRHVPVLTDPKRPDRKSPMLPKRDGVKHSNPAAHPVAGEQGCPFVGS